MGDSLPDGFELLRTTGRHVSQAEMLVWIRQAASSGASIRISSRVMAGARSMSNVPDAAVSCYALQGQFVAVDPTLEHMLGRVQYLRTADSRESLVPTMSTVGLGEDSMTQRQGDTLDSSDV